jgi:hypothetical protein
MPGPAPPRSPPCARGEPRDARLTPASVVALMPPCALQHRAVWKHADLCGDPVRCGAQRHQGQSAKHCAALAHGRRQARQGSRGQGCHVSGMIANPRRRRTVDWAMLRLPLAAGTLYLADLVSTTRAHGGKYSKTKAESERHCCKRTRRMPACSQTDRRSGTVYLFRPA